MYYELSNEDADTKKVTLQERKFRNPQKGCVALLLTVFGMSKKAIKDSFSAVCPPHVHQLLHLPLSLQSYKVAEASLKCKLCFCCLCGRGNVTERCLSAQLSNFFSFWVCRASFSSATIPLHSSNVMRHLAILKRKKNRYWRQVVNSHLCPPPVEMCRCTDPLRSIESQNQTLGHLKSTNAMFLPSYGKLRDCCVDFAVWISPVSSEGFLWRLLAPHVHRVSWERHKGWKR